MTRWYEVPPHSPVQTGRPAPQLTCHAWLMCKVQVLVLYADSWMFSIYQDFAGSSISCYQREEVCIAFLVVLNVPADGTI